MSRMYARCVAPWRSKSTIAAALFVAVIFECGASAHAHAFLDRASPAVGSSVHESPREVNLWFTEALEPVFSKIEVVDGTGRRVDRGDVKLDADDATILKASLRPLAPGSYKVIWRVISVDTHMTEGDYTFRLEPK